MKKITLLAALLVATTSLFAIAGRTIYLNTGGSSLWDQSGAKFGAYTFEPGGGTFSALMTPVEGESGIYSTTIYGTDTKIIFLRLSDTAVEPNWTDKWNQTGDLTLGADNQYTITGWGNLDGVWSTYSPTPVALAQPELIQLYANNGTIYANGDLQIFTLTGMNVTLQNGSLKGAYIVKVDGKTSKIMVQ